jgi:lipopolysaccharide export system permease protein
MGTLLTLGLLARHSEITALKGCGIGLRAISTPILSVSVLLSLLMLLNNEFLVPSTYREMKFTERVIIGKKSANTFFRQNNVWYRQDDLILQARLFDPATRTLKGVTVWQNGSKGHPTARIDAESASMAQNGWVLKQVTSRRFQDGNFAATEHHDTLLFPLSLQLDDLKLVDKDADNMGFLGLRRYAEKLAAGGYDPTRIIAQMHAKMATPFAPLVMSFLGIPFALRGGRSSGIAVGVGTSVVIGLVYFLCNAVLVSLGQTGILPPLVAAWTANALFIASGTWLTLTMDS